MPEQDLDVLMRSIGKAIRDAQHALSLHGVDAFRSHFAGEGEQARPRTVTVPVPRPDGGYAAKEVPTAALAHHDSLQLEEVRLRMRVLLSHAEDGKPPRVHVGPARPRAHDATPAADEFAEIELRFKRTDAPEGIARVSTEYHKRL